MKDGSGSELREVRKVRLTENSGGWEGGDLDRGKRTPDCK
jgi:hypothetical protein